MNESMNELFMNSLECGSDEVTLYETTESVHLQSPVDDAETKQYSCAV
jgi:hypothetical protein